MIVSPSLLSADFGKLNEEIELINSSEAEWLHLDIMDGVFVPNITFGFPVIKYIKKTSKKLLDVHMMIVEPQKFINELKDCGADYVSVHIETCTHLHRTIQQIKDAGMKAAVALNPGTPVCMLSDIITDLDMVLLMSVNPGFSGQKFIPNTLKKVKELKALISETNSKALIQVDGGVNETTGKQLKEAGVDIVVAGNYVFKSENPLEAIHTLHKL